MSRQDQYNVTVTVDTTQLGTFDKMTGGELDSEELKYKAGGMVPEISLGGSESVSNITLQRLYRLDRDLPLLPFLKSRVGKGAVTVSKQSLDVDGNPFGTPLIYNGKLKKVSPPEVNSEGANAALLELEISSASVA